MKMYKKLKKRQLEYISPKKWEMMSDEETENVKKYRRVYDKCRRREAKIKRDELKLDKLKYEMNQMLMELGENQQLIFHLDDVLKFGAYLIPIKRKGVVRYYNLSVSIKKGGAYSAYSFSLGSFDNVKKHLTRYYHNHLVILKKIKRDWISWFKMECKTPKRDNEERLIYFLIEDLIIKHKDIFRKLDKSINTIFPIN